jgi:hypothetical protein
MAKSGLGAFFGEVARAALQTTARPQSAGTDKRKKKADCTPCQAAANVAAAKERVKNGTL